MDESKVLIKEVYKIPPFKSLTVIDPMYLEDILNGKGTKGEKNLSVLMQRVRGSYFEIELTKTETTLYPEEPDSFEFTSTNFAVKIINPNPTVVQALTKMSKDPIEEIKSALDKNYYYPSLGKSVHRSLGTDTAEVLVSVDDKELSFKRYSDGYCGGYYELPKMAKRITVSFDEEEFTYEELKENLMYLFNFSEKDLISRETEEKDFEKKEQEDIER